MSNSKEVDNAIISLVQFADVYTRASIAGPYEMQLAAYVPAWIEEKESYRKTSIPYGTMFDAQPVALGKRDGLIFPFTPKAPLTSSSGTVARVELSLVDIEDCFPSLWERVEKRCNEASPKINLFKLNDQLISLCRENRSIHGILVDGFVKRQKEVRETAVQDALEDNELWGMI